MDYTDCEDRASDATDSELADRLLVMLHRLGFSQLSDQEHADLDEAVTRVGAIR